MMKKFTLICLLPLLSFSMAMAQEEAPYRGGAGDGYAMAEVLVSSNPTSVDKALTQAIQLYPNPLKKGEPITFQAPSSIRIDRIRLVDAQGNFLFERRQASSVGEANLRISISTQAWPAGIYFLQLESRQSTITKKIILL